MTLLLTATLAVCWFMVKAERPRIQMIPNYGRVYLGDTLTLKCIGTPTVKWLFNNKPLQSNIGEILILHAVSSNTSGDYQCETTEKSDTFPISVHEYLPPAVLTLVSRNAVVYKDQAVTLQLTLHEVLTGWTCFVSRKDKEFFIRIPEDKMAKTNVTFVVDVKGGMPEIIYCKHKTQGRSNSISLRTSDALVMLEIPPIPAVLGDPLTLRCEVEGGVAFKTVEFYKDGSLIKNSSATSYKITDVTDKDRGSYHCQADFRYNFLNPPGALMKNYRSVAQTLYIRARPPTARITIHASSLECSCPGYATDCFHWYYQESSTAISRWLKEESNILYPEQPGEYTCQAFWDTGVSRRSNKVVFGSNNNPGIVMGVVIVVILLLIVPFGIVWKRCRRDSTRHRDVRMKSIRKRADEEDDEKDDAYQRPIDPDKDEYHTLRGEDGGYEVVGAGRSGDGAEGGYEALKVTEQSSVYHTLQSTQTQGAEGGYEALKGQQIDTYQTLKPTAKDGEDGGYEAIKGGKAGATSGE